MEVTSITLNPAISLVFAFVLLSLSLLFVLSMSDQPIPEAVFEIQSTDVCERSLVDNLDGLSQGKKKTMLPFFSCTCYDFTLFFSSSQTSSRPFLHSVLRHGSCSSCSEEKSPLVRFPNPKQ